MDATDTFSHCRIVPVVVLQDPRGAVRLAETLRDAGITAIEITLRTAAALDAIECVATKVPGIVVGAGSVRTPDQLRESAQRGAGFVVSPGSSPALLQSARDERLPLVPGASSATEIMNLLDNGYQLQKFFPAEQCGGPAMLKALSAPLPEVRFFPTGGITAKRMPDYLKLDCVSCVGGSWFVSPSLLKDNDFQRIGELAEVAALIANG